MPDTEIAGMTGIEAGIGLSLLCADMTCSDHSGRYWNRIDKLGLGADSLPMKLNWDKKSDFLENSQLG